MNPTTRPRDAWTPIDYPWVSDRGDGTFQNPVLCADYSDPDLIRVGDDFWMTASSFTSTPGLPILRSRDLVNWTIVNHAIRNVPDAHYAQVQPGCGVWAPSIRHHDGKFWIFFPTPDEGIYVTTAADPLGAWSEPHLMQPGKGLIDPCPLWDDDGKAYLVHAYARSRAGVKNRLRVCPMAPDASRLLGEGKIVYDDPDRQPTLEGPKFYKHDGTYYILAPAGGVPTGWQLALRSRDPFGPYEPKILLAQGNTPVNGPHQGGLVDDVSGQLWFVHFQESLPYGRIAHLQPARWEDGWPAMGVNPTAEGVGEPVGRHAKPAAAGSAAAEGAAPPLVPQTSDDFEGATLGLQWQWNANHDDAWYALDARPGHLRLFAHPALQKNIALLPHALLQKLPARAFTVRTRIALGDGAAAGTTAGLILVGHASAGVALRATAAGQQILWLEDDRETPLAQAPACEIELWVHVADGGACRFGYRPAGGEPRDVERSFTAREGAWVGARVGLFATASTPAGAAAHNAYADIDFFRFEPPRA